MITWINLKDIILSGNKSVTDNCMIKVVKLIEAENGIAVARDYGKGKQLR